MLWQYIRRTSRFAFTDFAVRTDLINGLVSAVLSLLAGPKNKPVTALTTHDVAIYAAMALAAYALIRMLVIAPYQIWREDAARISLLEAELALPDRALQAAMKDHSISLRKELSQTLAKYVGLTQLVGNNLPSKISDSITVVDRNQLIELQIRIADILQEVSYDPILRTSVWNILMLCGKIVQASQGVKAPNDLLQRLKAQAKLTFKIIHYADPTGQVGAYAELENYLHEVGDPIIIAGVHESQSPQDIAPETQL